MKTIRTFIVTILVLMALLLFFTWLAAGGFGYRTTDIDDYLEFENYEGTRVPTVFPDPIADYGTDIEYLYHYRDGLQGDSCQIYLEVKYSEKDFKLELIRLQKRARLLDTVNFNYPAFLIGNQETWLQEYALYDVDERKVYYIYLESITKRSVGFDKQLLRKDYSNSWVVIY